MKDTWETLRQECLQCQNCELCRGRTQVVFGTGNTSAEVLFIGEGPGANEDLQGEPFVGVAGQLLDKMLFAIDLDRKTNAYIANIVKCRPPMNRDPKPEEQLACAGWLQRQIALLQPKVIVCLGRIAAGYMISPDIRITKEHGKFIKKDGVWMKPTFHPAALLRNAGQKPDAMSDFFRLREFLQTGKIPE